MAAGLLTFAQIPAAAATTVVFDTNAPSQTIFPSNSFTLSDPTAATGLRVALPATENHCDASNLAVCSSREMLNQLDGFSVNPRIMVCFSGPIDISTAASAIAIRPVPVHGKSALVALNQLLFDPASNCLFAKPDTILEQQTTYLLTVSDSLKDSSGKPVTASPAFTTCRTGVGAYCAALSSALGNNNKHAVAASLFTTMSATSWLEQAYQYVDQTQPGLALPAGFPWVFSVGNLTSFVWNPDLGTQTVSPQSIPLATALANVGSVAFGLFPSPNYLNPSGPDAGSITTSPNRPVAVPQLSSGLALGYVPVSFHVFLPKSPAPPSGYPAVIYGHGLSDSQFGAPTDIASALAAAGYATVAMEITGHGYGPNSTVSLKDQFGLTYNLLTPGRGIQLSPDQPIGPSDGCILPGPLAVRDCGRQTAVDLFALVKTIQRTNGLGLNLNPNSIFYVGQSFGSIYGTLFQAVSPDVKAAVLNAGGGPFVDVAKLAINGRALGQQYLCGLSLLNVPNPTSPSLPCPNPPVNPGAAPENYFHDTFNDNYVYRDQAPAINNVPGAIEIQAAFEAAEWLGMLGDVLSFAPHLVTSPLANRSPQQTLLQFGLGDLEVPNPTNYNFVRAAGPDVPSRLFDFRAATSIDPSLAGVMDPAIPYPFPILPHRILSNPTIFQFAPGDASENIIAAAEQQTVIGYFDAAGKSVPDSNSFLTGPFAHQKLFVPFAQLPSGLNFLQIAK